jgi:DNA primase catalytic subunit
MLIKSNFFFSKEECEEIVLFCEKVGVKQIHKVDAYNKWDYLRIHNNNFKERILKKYKEVFLNTTIFPFDLESIINDQISLTLTRYYDGRFLEMHRDVSSDFTTIIPLTDDFEDGRVVLSEEKISIENKTFTESNIHRINQGHGLTFDGGKVWHGVMPVYSGIRKSLNIWIDPDFVKIRTGSGDLITKTKKSFL